MPGGSRWRALGGDGIGVGGRARGDGAAAAKGSIRFDRNELSGAFGDFGTDFPLIVGMILFAGLDTASVLIMFGLMDLLTGFIYRFPMPVQPLKAVAIIVITLHLDGAILYGGGLAIGIAMLLLTVTGSLSWLARAVPKSVVRGIQFGLGLQLAILALGGYMPSDGIPGYALGAIAFAIAVVLLGNRRFPPAVPIVIVGVGFALLFKTDAAGLLGGVGLGIPRFRGVPTAEDLLLGFVLLAIPQIPLSLGNSILATRQVAEDLFPQRRVGIRKIGFTYTLMNLVNPFFGGIPTCHGSGGIAGHYAFGGRTGGSVILEGVFYLVTGLFFAAAFASVVGVFPLPVLGILLLFEALTLMVLVRDMTAVRSDFAIVLLIGLLAVGLPYGYVIGLAVGTALAHLSSRNLLGFAK